MFAFLGLGVLGLLFGFVYLSIHNANVFREKAEAYADKCVAEWREDGRKWGNDV